MVTFWVAVGFIVLALVLTAFGLTRLGGGSPPKAIFTAAMGCTVLGFVIAVFTAFTSGDGEPYPGPAADMGSEQPEAAETDTEMSEGQGVAVEGPDPKVEAAE